ncbi:MAG: lectin-like domain-containing protein [Enterococcus hulanensis]
MFKKKVLTFLASGLLVTTSSPVIGIATATIFTDSEKNELKISPDQTKEKVPEEHASSEEKEIEETIENPDAELFEELPVEDEPSQEYAVPYAALLPNDPNIIPIDKVFQNPIGNSTSILEEGKLLQLNPAARSQRGAIWSKKQISLLSDFTFKSYLYLGDQQGNAGDGMTFTLTNDDRMTSAPDQVIGSTGMGIGSYSTRSGQAYLRNSLSIEFDTYKNRGSADRMDDEIGGDTGGRGHVAFVTPKENNNNYSGEHSGVTVASTNLSNGTWRMLTVYWDSRLKQLTYNLDGIGSSSYVIDDINAKFGSTNVYWGFTSSTGGKYQENALAMTQIPTHVQSLAELSVNDAPFATDVEAVENDKIKIKNTLKIDNELNIQHHQFAEDRQPQVSMELPPKLMYEEGSLTVDGKKVAPEDISIVDSRITLDLNNYLVLEQDMAIELTAKLQGTTPEEVLAMNFEYSEEAELIQRSNQATIKVAKPKDKTITVFYKDLLTDQDIADPKPITGLIGADYQESPVDVAGFVFKNDSGNAEGIFAEDSQDIYFYYRTGELYISEAPSQVSFGTNKISNTSLIKFGEVDQGLRIMDERKEGAWRLQLKQAQPLTNGTVEMPEVLSFVTDSGTAKIGAAAITIAESDQKAETDLSGLLNHTKQRGIQTEIPVEYQRTGTFKGMLSWSLEDVPAN